jgi:drug/metabolite transporter (DMT)-like permease
VEKQVKKLSYTFILVAACLWGIISLFVQGLHACGFTSIQIVAIRVSVASFILLLYVGVTNKSTLTIRPSDGKYFIGTGLLSIVFFNWSYFTAIQETSASIAAILLYTAPAFVTLFSRILFKEWLTTNKVASLLMTFIGCAFVVGILPVMHSMISITGILLGLGAGFGYALYSIFGKFALRKYNALTVTTYTFVVASLGIIPLSRIWNEFNLFLNWKVWVYSIGLGLFSTVLPYLIYTIGLTHVESSKAAIVATLEPIVATVTGTIVFSDALTKWQLLGIFLVITAVIIVQMNPQGVSVRTSKYHQYAKE